MKQRSHERDVGTNGAPYPRGKGYMQACTLCWMACTLCCMACTLCCCVTMIRSSERWEMTHVLSLSFSHWRLAVTWPSVTWPSVTVHLKNRCKRLHFCWTHKLSSLNVDVVYSQHTHLDRTCTSCVCVCVCVCVRVYNRVLKFQEVLHILKIKNKHTHPSLSTKWESLGSLSFFLLALLPNLCVCARCVHVCQVCVC